jgi:hypothetical protein
VSQQHETTLAEALAPAAPHFGSLADGLDLRVRLATKEFLGDDSARLDQLTQVPLKVDQRAYSDLPGPTRPYPRFIRGQVGAQ